jgi:hypothetical protein
MISPICINILISDCFSFKCPYTYILDIFSCLFSTCCTKEWSKLVIKITKGENSYHLCSWHQWPFRTSRSWLQKFITRWKLIQSIIYKKHQVGWHLKYSLKLTSKKNSQKKNSFCVHHQKNPLCYILETFSLCIHFPHQKQFWKKKILNFAWPNNLLINN